MRPPHGIETMPIRQSQVQEDDVHSTLREMGLGFTHAQEMRKLESVLSFVTEHFAEQADISRVILNQKNLKWLFLHERASRGNLTTDSQKLSMLFTTVRNPSRPTGLVM